MRRRKQRFQTTKGRLDGHWRMVQPDRDRDPPEKLSRQFADLRCGAETLRMAAMNIQTFERMQYTEQRKYVKKRSISHCRVC